MLETPDLRNLTEEQMEKLPMDVRTGIKERMNTEASEKSRQIISENQSPIEATISPEKTNNPTMEEDPIRPRKKRKLPPIKKSGDSPLKKLPKKPGTPQKTSADQFGSSTTKKKFTVQISERLVREFKIEALKRGLNYSQLAEKAFTNIFITPGDSQPTPQD